MKQKYHLFILLLTILFSACKVQNKTSVGNEALATQKLEKKDESLFISSMKTHYIIRDSTQVDVYVEAEIENLGSNGVNSLEELNKKLKSNWILQPSTGIKEKLEAGRIEFEKAEAELDEKYLTFHFTIPRLRNHPDANLALEFIDLAASRKFTNDLFIDFNSKRPNHLFGVFINGNTFPSFDSYFQVGHEIVFKSSDGLPHQLTMKRYKAEAPAALSPMSTSKRNELGSYEEMESIDFTAGEKITLAQEGTYVVFLKDEMVVNGYGFLVTDDRFPRLTMPEELSEPLVYMSTNDEIASLKAAQEFKKALDLYFLTMTSGNQTLAKSIIKSYYRRVEKANQLFTSYKEGWKTDKGMIYLILGPPSRIQRNGSREVWLYAQSANFSEIIFTFYRKPNQFSEDHYELVRYPEYGAYWYPFVEAWRTGSVLE